MALKDLKSDLSKFRMPRKDSLVNKKRTTANKKQNQTPMSSMLKTTPDTTLSAKTPMKQGNNPVKFDNNPKFLGETNPDNTDNSSNFLGETNPTAMDNSSNFLGETNPNTFDNSSRFLGEVCPTTFDNSSNFLGETNPNTFDNSSNFLGETSQTPLDNSSNFLGETSQTPLDNSSKFLGETSPNIFDNSSNFLGETNAYGFDMSSKFLGETCPTDFTFNPHHINTAKTPSEVNYFPDIHARGFTSHFSSISDGTKFVGVNPDNTIFDTATSTYGNFGNSFPGISFAPGYGTFKPVGTYTGDTPRYNPDTKYFLDNQLTNKGISQLQEIRQSPSFLDKMYDKFNLKDDSYNTGFPTAALKHPLILRGIQKKGGEPEHYGQFGLSFDDGFVRGGSISAATRSAIDVARIGSWLITPQGILWGAKQSLLQFSNKFQNIWTPLNLLTAVGAQHLGIKPMRPGIIPFHDPLWSYAPNPLIQKDKLNTINTIDLPLMGYSKGTPFPTQTYFGGPMSVYGIGFTTTTRYENTFNSFKKDIFHILAKYQQKINPFKTDDKDKVYSPTHSKDRYGNAKDGVSVPADPEDKKTFGLADKTYPIENKIDSSKDSFSGDIKDDIDEQTFNPLKIQNPKDTTIHMYSPTDSSYNDAAGVWDSKTDTYKSKPYTEADLQAFGLHGKSDGIKDIDGILSDNNGNPLAKSPSTVTAIEKYETIAYGKIPNTTRVDGTLKGNDFRKLLSTDSENFKIADKRADNHHKRNLFGHPGNVGADRSQWWLTGAAARKAEGSVTRHDKINALPITGHQDPLNDLIHLWFEKGGEFIQFRGTVSALMETFSPSWSPVDYGGRADSGYKYSSFGRTLSFSFQVTATSRIEMKPIWEKLERLSTLTMPSYYNDDKGYKGNIFRFRLGSLYNDKQAFFTSLTYTMSTDVPWEISPLGSNKSIGELPRSIDVSVGLQILDGVQQKYKEKIYDFAKLRTNG